MIYKAPLIKFIYGLIWKNWLFGDKVLEVKGWRTALLETRFGARLVSSPCFKLFGVEFN